MVSEEKEPLLDILDKNLVFKLKFLKQLLDILPADFIGEEDMVELLKQFVEYDFSAETLRELQ